MLPNKSGGCDMLFFTSFHSFTNLISFTTKTRVTCSHNWPTPNQSALSKSWDVLVKCQPNFNLKCQNYSQRVPYNSEKSVDGFMTNIFPFGIQVCKTLSYLSSLSCSYLVRLWQSQQGAIAPQWRKVNKGAIVSQGGNQWDISNQCTTSETSAVATETQFSAQTSSS